MVIVLTVDRKSPQKLSAGNTNHLLSDNIVYICTWSKGVVKTKQLIVVIDDNLVITKQ